MSAGAAQFPFTCPVHSSPAVRAGQFVYASGFLGISPTTGRLVSKFSEVDSEGAAFATGMLAVDGWMEGVGSQFWQAIQNLKGALEKEGSSFGQLVLLNFYTMQMHHHHLVNALRSKAFEPTNTPPNTGMQPGGNPGGALIQATAVGFVPDNTRWRRSIIKESAVSQAMSAYDLGVQIGPFLFTGDFVPGSKKLQRPIETYDDVPALPKSLRPADLIRGSYEETIRAQTWFLYENIRDVLHENNARLEDIIKLRVYLVDMADAASFAEIHQAFFGGHRPVLTLATAAKLGRPEFRIAIEVTALVPQAASELGVKARFLTSEESVFPAGAAGVAAGSYIFLSNSAAGIPKGKPALDERALAALDVRPGASADVNFTTASAMVETWQALERGRRLLESAGASIDNVSALSLYLLSMDDLPAVDRVLRHVFPKNPPAVSVIQTPQMPVKGTRIEVEITAYKE